MDWTIGKAYANPLQNTYYYKQQYCSVDAELFSDKSKGVKEFR